MTNWKFELLAGLGKVSNMQDVLDTATKATHALGFDYCGWLSQLAQPFPKLSHLCLASDEHEVHRRIQQGAYDEAPVRRHCAQSTSPILWTGDFNDSIFPQAPELYEEYHGCGHRGGWAQSVILDDGMSYLFYTDSRNVMPLSELEQASPHLQWVAAAVHARMLSFRTPDNIVLSLRERDILRHIGDGLGLTAICQLMRLTRKTVAFHIGSALHKLEIPDVRTAVAQASFRGLLD